MQDLLQVLKGNIRSDQESARLFHGRGKKYPGYESIVVDSFPPTVLITLFADVSSLLIDELVQNIDAENILLQKRFLPKSPLEILKGKIPSDALAAENGMRFQLKLGANQNIGFFLDMAAGRDFLRNHAKDKSVLNLFSYTGSLSVAALKGGAHTVVNVDMSKGALETSEHNHHLNSVDMKKVRHLPYDILKSWKNINRFGPYDIVVIDPPTYQGESFKVERDYYKIVKRLNEMTSDEATVMACLNTPFLKSDFIKNMFAEHAPNFRFEDIIYSSFKEMEKDPEEGLKILIYKKN
jgi:23S rRNA (cytosine1962-C5)-methyltransferase